MSAMYQIEKLEEKNYDSWSIQMRSVLVHAELWKVTSGALKREDATDDANWSGMDQKALAMITLSVKPSQLGYVKNCATSFAAWTNLKEAHQPSGPLRKVSLYKKLLSLRMADGQNMSSFLNEFVEVLDQLAVVGIEMKDELRTIILLSSLPKMYESFVVAIETRDNLPKFETLCIKLKEEGERQGNEELHSEKSQAFTVSTGHQRTNTLAKAYTKRKLQNVTCFKCGGRGHVKAQCRNNESKTKREQQKQCSLLGALDAGSFNRSKWCLDSGATSHMCCEKDFFSKFETHTEMIGMAGEGFLRAEGRGEVKLQTDLCILKLVNVLYVPSMKCNFMSVSRAVENNCVVHFGEKHAKVVQDGECILNVNKVGNLYMFEGQRNKCFAAVEADAVLWHKRYGHLNYASLMEVVKKGLVRGIENINFSSKMACKTCMVSKIHVQPFPNATENRARELLELVHTDVCGPFETRSIGGSKYFLTFIDDKSRRIFVYFLRGKDEVFGKFLEFKNLVERQTGKKLKCIRSDNGREYVNKAFDGFLQENGIARQLTIAYTPQQNGVAERANRTLVEMSRCLLVQSGLCESLWAEAVYTAVYLRNRSTTRALINMTPMEAWTGKKPSISHLKVFGSVAVALEKGRNNSKFQAKGKEYRMVGYSRQAKGYRLYDAGARQVVEKRDVLFDELGQVEYDNGNDVRFDLVNEAPGSISCADIEVSGAVNNSGDDDEFDADEHSSDGDDYFEAASEERSSNNGFKSAAINDEEKDFGCAPDRPKLLRSGKQYNILSSLVASDVPIPLSYEEAMNSKYVSSWRGAMQIEYEALIANQTWTVADLPRNQRAIGCKWVFSLKRGPGGEIERFKARLVAKGCSQQYGVNYGETFSPVCRLESIRLILALAAELKLYLHQMDVCTAYLNSDLTDTVYMQQPAGYEDSSKPGKVLLLKKAIYGLKQAGREWNSKLDGVLRGIGFIPCDNEPCLYKQHERGNLSLILVYVDDLIIACQSKRDLLKIKTAVSSSFECVDKGQLHLFLGMEIQRQGELGEITLSQTLYIKELLRRHGSENCRPASTPLDAGYQVACDSNQCQKVDPIFYQSAIGELMWLALTTRPDILHSVAKLAQRNKDPHHEHLAGIKHILRRWTDILEIGEAT